MTNQEIEQKVKAIVSKKLDIELGRISAETRLAEDLGVDSFGALELMFEIEEAFGLKVQDSDLGHIRSVHDIVAHLVAWMQKAATPGSATGLTRK
jgi:acyl carrier protein